MISTDYAHHAPARTHATRKLTPAGKLWLSYIAVMCAGVAYCYAAGYLGAVARVVGL